MQQRNAFTLPPGMSFRPYQLCAPSPPFLWRYACAWAAPAPSLLQHACASSPPPWRGGAVGTGPILADATSAIPGCSFEGVARSAGSWPCPACTCDLGFSKPSRDSPRGCARDRLASKFGSCLCAGIFGGSAVNAWATAFFRLSLTFFAKSSFVCGTCSSAWGARGPSSWNWMRMQAPFPPCNNY